MNFVDRDIKAGYIMTLDDAIKFWTHVKGAEEALGEKLTQEERHKLLMALQLGKEVTMEELLEMMKGKKTLIVKDKANESKS
jgi:hypothetical protein